MKEIAATKFKEQCLALLESVGPDGLVITKRGRPVAKLIPLAAGSASLIGALRGRVKITGDAFSTVTRDRVLRRSRRIPLAR